MTVTGQLAEHRTTVLLIDDQAIVGAAVGKMLKSETDIGFHFCQDPVKAIQTAIEVRPTVILQDLVMPQIDGLKLVTSFRANDNTKDIPLIVLSTMEEPVVKAKAFELGANDYLVKLPDRIELVARIRHHSRGYISLLERNEAMNRLASELAEAAEYVRKLLPAPMSREGVRADWRFVPSASLGGDSFGYYWLDDDNLLIYLLDVCGHGIGAALLSISVMNVIRAQTLPDTDFRDPVRVLAALNDAFQMESHNNMYFTIWYGVYNKTGRNLVYASAGHPPALLMDSSGTKMLRTRNTIIGAFPGGEYRSERVALNGPARLYVFSDGAFEIRMPPNNEMWPFESFVELLAGPGPHGNSRLDRLWDFASGAAEASALDDDFSIMEITLE